MSGCCSQTASVQVRRPDAQLKKFSFPETSHTFARSRVRQTGWEGVFGASKQCSLRFSNSECREAVRSFRNMRWFQAPQQIFYSGSVYPIPRPSDRLLYSCRRTDIFKIRYVWCLQSVEAGSRSQKYLVRNIELFRFRRLPFGVSPVPAIIQRVMNYVLARISRELLFSLIVFWWQDIIKRCWTLTKFVCSLTVYQAAWSSSEEE